MRELLPFSRMRMLSPQTSGLKTAKAVPAVIAPARPRRTLAKPQAIAQQEPATAGAAPVADEIVKKVKYQFGKPSPAAWEGKDAYRGTAWSVHDRLTDAFDKTHEHWR